MKIRSFSFNSLSHSPIVVEDAQKAWDRGELITVVSDLEEIYRRDVEQWLINKGIVYTRLVMRDKNS